MQKHTYLRNMHIHISRLHKSCHLQIGSSGRRTIWVVHMHRKGKAKKVNDFGNKSRNGKAASRLYTEIII